jgi:quinoprotein glucose dehydrogenase
MSKLEVVTALARAAVICAVLANPFPVQAAEPPAKYSPRIEPASDEAEQTIKRFRVPKGFKVELVAAEPLLANPVAFCIDEHGRFFVAETFRHGAGVTDIRGHMNWLDEDLASRSVEDRVAMLKKHEGDRISAYTRASDRIRLLVDTDGDGRADKATVFAEGFSNIPDGIGSGVLARRGDVYFANIPDLWLLRDANGDGEADFRKSIHHGYGVRVGFLGHDLHGLCFGPDGKLYFSIGDRGAHVRTRDGKTVSNPETGAVYRCNPDGSELEIFAYGFRNPQELAFDNYGNLWTGDNNSDGGDPARWVYVVEGGDSGWRIGWQFIERPNLRGPWLAERMCFPDSPVAYMLPPVTNIANGPSGLAFYPGLGLPERYSDHFFLCDFRGGTGSGVYSFAVRPRGAGFELVDREEFVWEVLVTDGDFGYDGCFYITDWVNGWSKPGKGRIYRVFDPKTSRSPVVTEAKKLMAEGFAGRSLVQLVGLLTHPDKRVRQEAQFALAEKGDTAIRPLAQVARVNDQRVARLHGVWGLGQIARQKNRAARKAIDEVLPLLSDKDAEVRAQAAKVLGDARAAKAFNALTALLSDPKERPRFFAAIALGKLGRKEAALPLVAMLRANDNRDRHLRHAAVMGLAGCADPARLKELATDPAAAVRMGALLALRRLQRPEVAAFLDDSDVHVVIEAARAANDLPVPAALPALAAKAAQATRHHQQILDLQPPAKPKPETAPTSTTLAVETVDLSTALFRRVINANFRLGTPASAAALTALAASGALPESLRAEALTALGDWAKPSGRDRVTGLWRPLDARDAALAKAALQPQLDSLLRDAPPSVKLAAIAAAGRLGISSAAAAAHDLLTDRAQPANVRVEALRLLASQRDSRLPDAVKLALSDSNERLRHEATRLQAQLQPDDAVTQLRSTLANGALREKQSALITLGTLNNAAADDLVLQWLDRLLAGQVPPELQLEIVEAAARRPRQPFQAKLHQFEDARPAEDDLRAYRECLTGGDANEGRRIFLERPEASCVRCHKVNGEGGEAGPDLTGIGAKKPREYLLEAVIFPNKAIAEGFESVLVTMKDGAIYAGVVKSETATVLELNSPEDGLLKLNKADIQTRTRGLSAMPEELRQVLTKRDLRDLVEFLGGLK